MKERLVEIIQQMFCDAKMLEAYSDKGANALADYLLANGVIVPPCKVGDVVYNTTFGEVNGYIVDNMKFTYTADGLKCDEVNASGRYSSRFGFENIGKTVFLSREEAEAKLREVTQNG